MRDYETESKLKLIFIIKGECQWFNKKKNKKTNT